MILKEIYNILNTSRSSRWAMRYIIFLIVIAMVGPFLSNDVPLMLKSEKGISFPVMQQLFKKDRFTNFKQDEQWALYPLIPYSEKTIDLDNSNYKGPFDTQNIASNRYRHWLGTDRLGRDTLAGLIRGTSTALKVGFFSSIIASIIGIVLGLFSGYFGDNGFRVNLAQILILGIGIIFVSYQWTWGFFYGYEQDFIWEILAFVIIGILCLTLYKLVGRFRMKQWQIPIDYIVSWILEIFKSIPPVFIILALLSILITSSIWNIIWIIALVSWPLLTRYTRAEVLNIKSKDYISSAQVAGYSDFHILRKHVLVNAIGPVIVTFAFSCSAAIVLEATLSFLGLGLAVEEVTWGSMLAQVKSNYNAWWLVVFPGLAIFFLIIALNNIGKKIEQRINPQTS